MSTNSNSSRRIRMEDLHVDEGAYPGWSSGIDRLPSVGEHVYCTAGLAEVVRVHGKTGDGTRILELNLLDGTRHPFFCAASNVRVPPVAAAG
jgi:hypothetical protein